MIRRRWWLVLTAALLAPAALARGEEKEQGFVPLYREGNPLEAGWKQVGPGSVTEESPGVLVTSGGMGMLWYARQPFKDFTLRLEYKLSNQRNNSGVFVRFPNPPKSPWDAVNEGYEIQIDDFAPPSQHTGAIYSFKPPEKVPTPKPVGEWNAYEITVKGQDYSVILNGERVNTYKGSRGTTGFVGLQNHDPSSVVRFRNVRIKSLD